MLRPETFLRGRLNGQYIIEGLVASITVAIGSIGILVVESSAKGRSTFIQDIYDIKLAEDFPCEEYGLCGKEIRKVKFLDLGLDNSVKN